VEKERRVNKPLRCEITTWWMLPDGTETPRVQCAAPATVRSHLDTTQPVPRIETDHVCEEHWFMMYRCQHCGVDKGTWRGHWCRACVEDSEESSR